MSKRLTLFAFLTVLAWASASPAAVHNFHTSLTRVDYDEKQRLVEITVQLFVHDLVPILEDRFHRKVDLDTKTSDTVLLEYLRNKIALKDKQGNGLPLEWVGKEIKTQSAYVYLQVADSDGIDGLALKDTIFFESFPEQTNYVVVRSGRSKASLLFVAGELFKPIVLSEIKK